MFNKILTHFSLFTLLVQTLHLSFLGVLYASTSTVTYAQNMSLEEIYGNFQTPGYSYGNASVGGSTLNSSELFGLDANRVASEGQFTANQAYQNENKLSNSGQGVADRFSTNVVGSEVDYDAKAYNTLKSNYNDNYQKLESEDSIMTDADNILKDLANGLDDPDSDFFSACTTETNTYSVNREYVGKMTHECSEPDRTNLNSCEIKRHVDYPVLKTAGTGQLTFVDDYTFQLIVGNPSEHINGSCAEYNYQVQIKLRDDLEIASVRMKYALFDDHIQIYLNNDIIYQHAYISDPNWRDANGFPYTNLNPKSGQPDANIYSDTVNDTPYELCERSTVWRIGDGGSHGSFPNGGDVTAVFNAARTSGSGYINFRNRVAAADQGNSYSVIEIKTKQRAAPKEYIQQEPPGCATQLGYVQPHKTCDIFGQPGDPIYIDPQCGHQQTFGDGQAGAICSFSGWKCVEKNVPPSTYASYVSSLPITVPGETQNPIECSVVNAENYKCDPLGSEEICGQPNWPESDEVVCTTFSEFNSNIPDRCEPYRDDGDCTLISQEPSFVDPITGRSYVTQSTYECNNYTNGNYSYTMEEDICTGDMRCVGGDCRYSEVERNDDFAEAMATFKMLEDIKSNMSCDNPDDVRTCRVFNGEASYCGIEQTGLGFNCCTLTAGQTNVFDYIKGIFHQYAMEQAMDGLSVAAANGAGFGSWATDLSSPVTDTVSYVTEAVSSGWDYVVRNVTGEIATESGSTLASDVANDALLDQVKSKVYEQIYNILPDGIRDAIFNVATETAADGTVTSTVSMNPAVSGAFSAIMAAYMAYQLVKLAAMMVSECDDLEMGMGIKLDQGQCIYDSTSCHKDTPFGCLIKRKHYCCYPSPLGRIIMSQAAPLLGMDLNPLVGQCNGMTIEQVSELNWDQIDLSEWENLIMASGLAVEHDSLDIDSLSSQPWMPNNGSALNPVELNQERFEAMDAAENLKETHDAAMPETLDCSVYPRPPVCDSPLSIIED